MNMVLTTPYRVHRHKSHGHQVPKRRSCKWLLALRSEPIYTVSRHLLMGFRREAAMSVMDDLGHAQVVLLETRKRDGTWVGTPVSVVEDGQHAYFKSYDASGKAKRLRNFPDVKVAPSTMRGKPTGPSVAGKARLLDGADSRRVEALLARKH